jgi:hypothetical protein
VCASRRSMTRARFAEEEQTRRMRDRNGAMARTSARRHPSSVVIGFSFSSSVAFVVVVVVVVVAPALALIDV